MGQEKGTTTPMVSNREGCKGFSGKVRWDTFGLHGVAIKWKLVVFGPNPGILARRILGRFLENYPRQKRDLREAYASMGYSGSL